MRQILRAILLLYMAVEAEEDIRRKTVSVKMAVCFAAPAAALQIFWGWQAGDGGGGANAAVQAAGTAAAQATWIAAELAAGMLPGLLLMAAAGITGQAIGYGDGLVLAVCGVFVKVEGSVGILLYGLFFSAAVALYLLIVKKAGRKKEIPFVPCLLGGYVLWLYFGG